MKGLANEPCCGTVGNKIDPCGKLFSQAGRHNDFYLCGLTYSALENALVQYENLQSSEKKKSRMLFCHAGGPEKQ